MGHVNPEFCQQKDNWRWKTSNSEYGKFYVQKIQREEIQEAQSECFKKCEELTNKLHEAQAQLEKLKLSRDWRICGPEILQDEACQTSPISPTSPKCNWTIATKQVPPYKKLYKTLKKKNNNGLEGHDSQMLLENNVHHVKHERQKIPVLPLQDARNNNNDQDNGDVAYSKTEIPSVCELRSLMLRSNSRHSSITGSAKDCEHVSPCKRKTLQKQKGVPKKQKGSMIKTTLDLKCTAAGGANLPPSQRYNFYRNYGYGGQGAKTSKGWHSLKSPWMPS